MVSEPSFPWTFPTRNPIEKADLFPSAMKEYEQKMERYRKEDNERQQRFKEEWKLLREKGKEIDKKILKSLSELAQSIREYKEVSESSVAPQVLEEKLEQKPEPTNFNLEGKTKEIMEQLPNPKQTDFVGAVNLLIEKCKSEKVEQQPSLMKQTTVNQVPYGTVKVKPNPTFRSPLPSNQWLQTIHSCTKTTTETIPILLAIQKPTPTFRSPITNPNPNIHIPKPKHSHTKTSAEIYNTPNKHEFNPIPTDFSVVPSMNLSSNGADMVALLNTSSDPQDIKREDNLDPIQESLPLNSSTIYGQAILMSKFGLCSSPVHPNILRDKNASKGKIIPWVKLIGNRSERAKDRQLLYPFERGKKMLMEGLEFLFRVMISSAPSTSIHGSALYVTSEQWGVSTMRGGSLEKFIAAVVSVRRIMVSLGSYIGGSIKQTMSNCGVFCLKPTYTGNFQRMSALDATWEDQAMGSPGKFQLVWQVQFTVLLHSWGQECFEEWGIVTIL